MISGHVHGTAAYDITSTGEPAGAHPHFWEAIQYKSGEQMQHLKNFIISEGEQYQLLQLAREDMKPNKSTAAPIDGLDGWAYMMRNAKKNLALLYFEHGCALPVLHDFLPKKEYTFQWYNPAVGEWTKKVRLTTNKKGILSLPDFPEDRDRVYQDWAAKIVLE
jgi:hypothetical protein